MVNQKNNQDEIEILRAEFARIPAALTSSEEMNRARRQRIAELDAAVANLNRDAINPCETRITKLEARKTVLTAPARISELSAEIQPLQTALADLTQRHMSVMSQLVPLDENIRRYRSAIDIIQAQSRNNEVSASLRAVSDRCYALESELSSLRSARNAAESNLSHARSRLSSLQTQQSFDYAFNHSPFHNHYDYGYGHHHHHHGHVAGQFIHAVGDGVMASNIYSARNAVSGYESDLSHAQDNFRSCESRLQAARRQEADLRAENIRLNHTIESARPYVNQAALTLSIPELQAMEQEQQLLRAPLERQRAELQAQIDSNNHARSGLVAERDNLSARHVSALQLVETDAEMNLFSDVAEIEKQLSQERNQREQHWRNLANIQSQKRENEQAVAQTNTDIANIKARQLELSIYLKYPNAVTNFETALLAMAANNDYHTKIYQCGWNLVEEIKKEKATHPEKFDSALYSDILEAATCVLTHRDDLYWPARLSELAEKNKSGKLSVAKTVIGAIGLFIGASLLFAGSLFLGSFIPLLSWPIAAAGVAAGAGLIAGGIALLVNGRQKGIDKAAHQFIDAIPAANHRASLFYQQAPPPPYEYHQQYAGAQAPSAPPLGV